MNHLLMYSLEHPFAMTGILMIASILLFLSVGALTVKYSCSALGAVVFTVLEFLLLTSVDIKTIEGKVIDVNETKVKVFIDVELDPYRFTKDPMQQIVTPARVLALKKLSREYVIGETVPVYMTYFYQGK